MINNAAIRRLLDVVDDIEQLPGPATTPVEYRYPRVGVNRLLLFGAPIAAFLVVGALTFANTSDDPLITLRYASNLIHHGQPVFNPGERVEGYTSPLHLMVATLVLLLPGGLALFKLKLVSLLFGAAAIWQTGRLSRALCLPRWAEVAALVALAGSWNFMVSASNGLETSLVAFLATGTTVSLVSAHPTQRWWRPAIWAAFLALSRPDAVLIIALLAIVSLVRQRSSPSLRRIYWLSGPAVALGTLEIFRLAYYGSLLPNTYFAKQLGVGPSVVLGARYLFDSQPLSGRGLGAVSLVIEVWLISIGVRRFLRARPAMAYPISVLIGEVLFVLGSGGDWMKGGRFLAPAIPAATVLMFSGVEALVMVLRASRTFAGLVVTAVVALLVAPVNGASVAPAWWLTSGVGDRSLIADGQYPLSPIWVAGVGLADCLKAGQSAAYSEVGLFGYEHPGLRVIDTRGLTSKEIASDAPTGDRHPWGVQDPQWFLTNSVVGRALTQQRPDMIISFDVSAADSPSRLILRGLYRRAAIIPEPSADHTLLVYLRRDVGCSPIPAS
jgi:hypothetical protein